MTTSPRLTLVDGAGGNPDQRETVVALSPFVRDLPEEQMFQTQALVDVIDHAVQAAGSAEQVILIEGDSGIGKTILLRRLATLLGRDSEVCHIEASLSLGERHVLAAVAEGFACPPAGSSGELASMLARRSMDQDNPPLIIVDNADRLSSFALAALFELKRKVDRGGGRLAMILSAKPGRLDATLDLPAFSAYQENWLCRIELPRLNEQETAAYLEHRIEAAGMQDTVMLDGAQLRRVFRGSRGIPRYIDYLADDLLHGRRPRVYRSRRYRRWTKRSSFWIPAAGFAVLLAVVAAFLINLLFSGPPAIEVAFDAPVPGEKIPVEPAPPAPTIGAGIDQSGSVSTEAETDAEHRQDTASAGGGETVRSSAAKPQAVKPVVIDSLEGGAWLMAQPADRYTVQLASTPDETLAARFIEKNPLNGKTTVVPTRRGDRIIYLVIHGSFDGPGQAGDAIAVLPQQIRKNQPFSRTIGSLQSIAVVP